MLMTPYVAGAVVKATTIYLINESFEKFMQMNLNFFYTNFNPSSMIFNFQSSSHCEKSPHPLDLQC